MTLGVGNVFINMFRGSGASPLLLSPFSIGAVLNRMNPAERRDGVIMRLSASVDHAPTVQFEDLTLKNLTNDIW